MMQVDMRAPLAVQRLTGRIDLSDEVVAALSSAVLPDKVVFLRGQTLDDGSLAALRRGFGT